MTGRLAQFLAKRSMHRRQCADKAPFVTSEYIARKEFFVTPRLSILKELSRFFVKRRKTTLRCFLFIFTYAFQVGGLKLPPEVVKC